MGLYHFVKHLSSGTGQRVERDKLLLLGTTGALLIVASEEPFSPNECHRLGLLWRLPLTDLA